MPTITATIEIDATLDEYGHPAISEMWVRIGKPPTHKWVELPEEIADLLLSKAGEIIKAKVERQDAADKAEPQIWEAEYHAIIHGQRSGPSGMDG